MRYVGRDECGSDSLQGNFPSQGNFSSQGNVPCNGSFALDGEEVDGLRVLRTKPSCLLVEMRRRKSPSEAARVGVQEGMERVILAI